MYIEQLIKELEKCKKEYENAQCFVGHSPQALYVVMGHKTIMFKLDGDWECSLLEERERVY